MSVTHSTPTSRTPARGRFTEADCSITDFAALVDQTCELVDYPYATAVEQNVVVYDAGALRAAVASPARRLEVEAELVMALTTGPGVVALRGAFDDSEQSTGRRSPSTRSSPRSAPPVADATTTSPRPGPTTGSGTRWRSWPSAIPAPSSTTTATTSSP